MEKTLWLTVEVAKQLIGKKIEWRAPMDEAKSKHDKL